MNSLSNMKYVGYIEFFFIFYDLHMLTDEIGTHPHVLIHIMYIVPELQLNIYLCSNVP